MPERLGVPEWRRLYTRLTGESPIQYEVAHPGAVVVETAASQFEDYVGYKLPQSYKAFAQVFGTGEIGGYFRIWIPGDKDCDYDLATEYQRMHEFFGEDDSDEQAELRKRLILFASTIGGEHVGWDPLEVTDAKREEYRIYYVTRRGTTRAIAASFSEFIAEICLKNRLHLFFGWQNQEPADWPPQTFLSYQAKR